MADNATIYAPLYVFPTQEQLETLSRGSAEVEADEERQHATIRWEGGATIHMTRLGDAEMGKHLTGLRSTILGQGGGEGLATRALSTLSVYPMLVEPRLDPAVIQFMAALTAATDGFCFIDGQLVDGDGNDLLQTGASRPDAMRVVRRALVLFAGAFRALLEEDAGTDEQTAADALRNELLDWLQRCDGLVEEAEMQELAFLQIPIGRADPRAVVRAVWRAEGAQVLLWALRARELPPHDAQEHPFRVCRELGVLAEVPPPLYSSPALRDEEELEWMRRRLLGLNWRMTNLRVSPTTVDFRNFATENWFGGFDLEGIELVDDDLSVDGETVTTASSAAVQITTSIALERHRAINWLIGAHPTYSAVVTPT